MAYPEDIFSATHQNLPFLNRCGWLMAFQDISRLWPPLASASSHFIHRLAYVLLNTLLTI
jgi:hypothetical protein